jgi:hypothetical protein
VAVAGAVAPRVAVATAPAVVRVALAALVGAALAAVEGAALALLLGAVLTGGAVVATVPPPQAMSRARIRLAGGGGRGWCGALILRGW